jgi:diguanylate cyclase (GGDEF)-like protein
LGADSFADHEDKRLEALNRYDILDTAPEESFERFARLARNIFRVPISTISFVDGHRQWLKSHFGLNFAESRRCDSICDLAIQQQEPLVIEDTTKDARVSHYNLVIGPPHMRFYAGAQLRTHDGYNLGTLCIIDLQPREFGPENTAILADLAKMVVAELDLRLVANVDHLTGTLSRRAFKEELDRAKLLALRHGHPLSCVTFDLDHFKSINDQYGHAMGDIALKRSVEACRTVLRKSDSLGRIGGEEFATILPHTPMSAAAKVAEKMRQAIAGLTLATPTGPVRITASFGVAELDRATPDIDELLLRADEALYASKHGGRNQCSQWHATGSAPANIVRKVFKAGQIAFNGGNSVIDCTVRGLSPEAAILNVVSPADVPEKFKLRINSDNTSRFCRVTAKRDKQIEVTFA